MDSLFTLQKEPNMLVALGIFTLLSFTLLVILDSIETTEE